MPDMGEETAAITLGLTPLDGTLPKWASVWHVPRSPAEDDCVGEDVRPAAGNIPIFGVLR